MSWGGRVCCAAEGQTRGGVGKKGAPKDETRSIRKLAEFRELDARRFTLELQAGPFWVEVSQTIGKDGEDE